MNVGHYDPCIFKLRPGGYLSNWLNNLLFRRGCPHCWWLER